VTRAVCDTGPLTHLWQIGQWTPFHTFDELHLSEQVVQEVHQHVDLSQLASLINIPLQHHIVPPNQVAAARTAFPAGVTLQDADLATLIVAQNVGPDFVLTDDLTLRRVLEQQGFIAMGSVGLLLRAYQANLLDASMLEEAIDRLFVHSTLYLSPRFRNYVSRLMNDILGRDS
jgi:predicted nucleic acid-binding protein